MPLALALALLRLPARATVRDAARWLAPALRWLVGALAVASVAIFAWDAARQAPIGFWSQGYADNVPGRLVRANEVVPRALAWITLLHYGTASTLVNGVGVAGVLGLLAASARRPGRAALADALLAGFVLLYLAAYWLLAFNVWDRYLVPLLPLLALLGARALQWIGRAAASTFTGQPRAPLASAALALLAALVLAPGAATAARSGYPIGGDHGAYDGVDDAARFLRTLPKGSVLYDRWLSWQWNFYLFDAPVYVAWLPSPGTLATDLQAFGHTSPRYFVSPNWEPDGEIQAAAAGAGFAFVPRHHSYRRDGSLSLTVYQLVPLGQPATQAASPSHDQP